MREGESLSIENQRFILQKYADDYGFLNCKFYVDDGYSGSNFNRPSYKEMMSEVERGNVSAVIVKDQSRLGRDYLQTGMLMEVTFPQYDVRFIAINDGVDSANDTSDYAGIRNYFNDLFARDTSRKIRAVQRAKGEREERVGTNIPYGYMKNPDEPKQLLPNPETAPVVKRIFKMYASGIGIRKICTNFFEEQIVLEDLRSATDFARKDPEKFYAMAAKNGEAEAEKLIKDSEREKEQIRARIAQLDSIIRCPYEDRVTGRITPERYDSLANGYEHEQSQLKLKLLELDLQINTANLREECIRKFMLKAKEYIEMPSLTPELLRTFIRRIEVYEKTEKYLRTCGNTIVIHYTFEIESHQS